MQKSDQLALSPENADREILRQLVPIVENHNQVHVELNFEITVHVRGTRVRIREKHVERNFQVWEHVAVSNLDILNLRRVSLALKSFDAHKLDLD